MICINYMFRDRVQKRSSPRPFDDTTIVRGRMPAVRLGDRGHETDHNGHRLFLSGVTLVRSEVAIKPVEPPLKHSLR